LGDGNGASRAANCKTLMTGSFDCNNLEPKVKSWPDSPEVRLPF
jgi:hypothetical protein